MNTFLFWFKYNVMLTESLLDFIHELILLSSSFISAKLQEHVYFLFFSCCPVSSR